jgi:hypothetical protein
MAFKLSVTARNATLQALEDHVGNNAILTISTGTPPLNCAAANTGTVLASMTLPDDWLGEPSGGVVDLSGSWQDLSANASGTAGYFRLFDSAGTTCHMQGNISAPGAGGDMQLDNTNIASGQQITVTSFVITAGGA